MSVLILAELNGNELAEDATAKAVSAAKGSGRLVSFVLRLIALVLQQQRQS